MFEDNIKSLVSKDNVEGQVVLITKLLNHNFGHECVKWLRFYDMDVRQLPEHLRNKLEYAERNQSRMGTRLEKPREHNAYQLDMQRVELVFVNNPTSFGRMLGMLSAADVELLTFDLEWKPTYTEHTEVALLQLAIPGHVFVVDKLSQEVPLELWRQLGGVMSRLDVVRVGFGCTEDVVMLAKDTTLGVQKVAISQIVDFSLLWNVLEREYKKEIEPVHCTPGRGLKDLVKAFLGKNLDKRMQMSDWSLRPLRPEQIRYAALDAYCLVDVYGEVRRRLAAKNVDIYEVLEKYQRKYVGTKR